VKQQSAKLSIRTCTRDRGNVATKGVTTWSMTQVSTSEGSKSTRDSHALDAIIRMQRSMFEQLCNDARANLTKYQAAISDRVTFGDASRRWLPIPSGATQETPPDGSNVGKMGFWTFAIIIKGTTTIPRTRTPRTLTLFTPLTPLALPPRITEASPSYPSVEYWSHLGGQRVREQRRLVERGT